MSFICTIAFVIGWASATVFCCLWLFQWSETKYWQQRESRYFGQWLHARNISTELESELDRALANKDAALLIVHQVCGIASEFNTRINEVVVTGHKQEESQ